MSSKDVAEAIDSRMRDLRISSSRVRDADPVRSRRGTEDPEDEWSYPSDPDALTRFRAGGTGGGALPSGTRSVDAPSPPAAAADAVATTDGDSSRVSSSPPFELVAFLLRVSLMSLTIMAMASFSSTVALLRMALMSLTGIKHSVNAVVEVSDCTTTDKSWIPRSLPSNNSDCSVVLSARSDASGATRVEPIRLSEMLSAVSVENELAMSASKNTVPSTPRRFDPFPASDTLSNIPVARIPASVPTTFLDGRPFLVLNTPSSETTRRSDRNGSSASRRRRRTDSGADRWSMCSVWIVWNDPNEPKNRGAVDVVRSSLRSNSRMGGPPPDPPLLGPSWMCDADLPKAEMTRARSEGMVFMSDRSSSSRMTQADIKATTGMTVSSSMARCEISSSRSESKMCTSGVLPGVENCMARMSVPRERLVEPRRRQVSEVTASETSQRPRADAPAFSESSSLFCERSRVTSEWKGESGGRAARKAATPEPERETEQRLSEERDGSASSPGPRSSTPLSFSGLKERSSEVMRDGPGFPTSPAASLSSPERQPQLETTISVKMVLDETVNARRPRTLARDTSVSSMRVKYALNLRARMSGSSETFLDEPTLGISESRSAVSQSPATTASRYWSTSGAYCDHPWRAEMARYDARMFPPGSPTPAPPSPSSSGSRWGPPGGKRTWSSETTTSSGHPRVSARYREMSEWKMAVGTPARTSSPLRTKSRLAVPLSASPAMAVSCRRGYRATSVREDLTSLPGLTTTK